MFPSLVLALALLPSALADEPDAFAVGAQPTVEERGAPAPETEGRESKSEGNWQADRLPAASLPVEDGANAQARSRHGEEPAGETRAAAPREVQGETMPPAWLSGGRGPAPQGDGPAEAGAPAPPSAEAVPGAPAAEARAVESSEPSPFAPSASAARTLRPDAAPAAAPEPEGEATASAGADSAGADSAGADSAEADSAAANDERERGVPVGQWARQAASVPGAFADAFRKKGDDGPAPAPGPVAERSSAEARGQGNDGPAPAAARPPADPPPEARRVPRDERWAHSQATLFGRKKLSSGLGLYVGATGVQTGFGSGGSGTWGLEGGAVLIRSIVLGGAAYSSGAFDAGGHPARFLWGGVQPGWIWGSRKLIHLRTDVLLGSGVVLAEGTGDLVGRASVATPRAALELNLTRSLRLSGAVGWRFVDAPGDVGSALSGPELGLTLRVGWL